MSNFETLIPGLLVSLKTTLTGNIQYKTRDLIPTESAPESGTVAEWQTTRVIADAAEYEAAKKVRSKARSTVAGVCVSSAFGLLCPESKGNDLRAAVIDAQRLAAEFNATSKITRVGVFVITGKVASDDEQAIRAINSEIADLIAQMQEGAANLDPAAIREAANKARDVSMMLSPATQERVGAAIELARKEARRLVKAGETAGKAVDQSVVAALAHSRTAFLDVDTVAGDVAAPVQESVAVDFEVADVAPVVQSAPAIELETSNDVDTETGGQVDVAPVPQIETESPIDDIFGDDESESL